MAVPLACLCLHPWWMDVGLKAWHMLELVDEEQDT